MFVLEFLPLLITRALSADAVQVSFSFSCGCVTLVLQRHGGLLGLSATFAAGCSRNDLSNVWQRASTQLEPVLVSALARANTTTIEPHESAATLQFVTALSTQLWGADATLSKHGEAVVVYLLATIESRSSATDDVRACLSRAMGAVSARLFATSKFDEST
jgi:hypothetical protein